MASVVISNRMTRRFVLNIKHKDAEGNRTIKPIIIESGLQVTVDADAFEVAKKESKPLQAHLDERRLVVAKSLGAASKVHPDVLSRKSASPEKPKDLKDTKDAEKGKAKHEVKKVETAEVEQGTAATDKPKGGKKKK